MRRLHYLDNLMIFLSVLVVLHHVGVGYGTMGGWCYVTDETLTGTMQIFFSALFGLEASFSMSLFFFFSAYLTIPSLEKKGASGFIKARMIRLAIPLFFVMIVLAPTILFFIEIRNHSTELSWFEYVRQQNITSPNTSHAWFILVLIGFESLFVFYWAFVRPRFSVSKYLAGKIPSHAAIIMVILLCSFMTIAIRQFFPIGRNFIGIQFANIAPYILMYAVGLLAYRKQWLDGLTDKVANVWFPVSVVSAAYFCMIMYRVMKDLPLIDKYISGFSWESVSLSFTDTLLCIGFSGFFVQLFRRRLDFSNPVLSKMRENRYGVYIFHSAVVVGITILLEPLAVSPIFRFLIACVLSVVVSYLVVGLIRNIDMVKRVIGRQMLGCDFGCKHTHTGRQYYM